MNIYYEYCTYITFYSGNKLPPFYVGSTNVQKVENGYHGSVTSAKYVDVWRSELLDNPQLFRTIIVTRHATREEALERESDLHHKLDVVRNPLYINQSYAKGMFGIWTKESIEKANETRSDSVKSTFNDPEWKASAGAEMRAAQKKTYNDPEWKATVGVERKRKEMKTKSDPYWQETVWAEALKVNSAKATERMNDPEWLATTGVIRIQKQKATKSSIEWRESIGKDATAKMIKSLTNTLNDPAWKATVGATAAKKKSQSLSGRKRFVIDGKIKWLYPDGNGGHVTFKELKKLRAKSE